MDEFKVIEIKKSVFENNDREADRIRERLKKEHTFLLNLMSSPGSGKTTTLKATISRLKDEMKIGVMEADIDSSVDAKAIAETGVKSIQLHTLGMCHLDAGMTEQGIDEFGTDELDLVVLENVGNPLRDKLNKWSFHAKKAWIYGLFSAKTTLNQCFLKATPHNTDSISGEAYPSA